MGLPRFIWIQKADANIGAGYDLANRQVVMGVSLETQVFDALEVNADFKVFTDFSSATDFVFNMGLKYQFGNFQASSDKAFKEARKEATLRKIQACELFYDYLTRRVTFDGMTETDPVSSLKKRMEQIELAYLLIQIQTLSDVSGDEPDPVDIETLQFTVLREEDLKAALLNYAMILQKDIKKDTSFYLNMQAVSEQGMSYMLGGPGLTYQPQNWSESNLDDRLQEVSMRKMILEHEVLLEVLPEMKQQIEEVRSERNKLSRNYILGKIDEENLQILNQTLSEMEDLYASSCMKVLKIEALFRIMRGEW
jgi:hypothetical protein